MKYGIVGSRKRLDKQSVIDFVKSLNKDDIVISGGCNGVDTWAIEAAECAGLQTIEFLPDLTGCKTRHEFTKAYFSRNLRIAAECDTLVAFVSKERTGGTENTIRHALKLNKPVVIL